MARRVMDTFSGITPPPQETPEVSYRPPDWEQIFGSALAGDRRGRGAAANKPRGGRKAATLHDEIVEDGGDE
jgi:hypothetical protein